MGRNSRASRFVVAPREILATPLPLPMNLRSRCSYADAPVAPPPLAAVIVRRC